MAEQMKDSGVEWIGEIPYDWKAIRFRYVFSLDKGLTITKEDLVDDGVPVISYGQVHAKTNTGTGINDSLIRYVPELYLGTDRQSLAYQGNYIFADTSEDLGGVGNCVFIDINGALFAGYHTIISRIKGNSSEYFPKYFSYLFLSDMWRDQLRSKVMGVKVYSISQKLLKDTSILLPPKIIQQAIADYLDKECAQIDSIAADLEKQIELLQQYKQSLITETVTKGLDKSVPMKDSGVEWIGEIPNTWDCKKMKYVISEPLQYGANEAGDDYKEDYPRYIRITDITEENSLKDDGKLSLSPDIAKPYLLKDGDLLFARSGATVGKTFYYISNYGTCAFAGYLIKARFNKDKMNPKFVYYTTLGIGYENWKNTVFTQATIQNIGADKYAQFYITVPPMKEQNEIIAYLDAQCKAIDDVIHSKYQQLSTIQKHKKSLIYEYVTGKKRVKEVQ